MTDNQKQPTPTRVHPDNKLKTAMDAVDKAGDAPLKQPEPDISNALTEALDGILNPAKAPEGYEELAAVLARALHQSADGKGRARHARNDVPFMRQPIMELPRMVGPQGTAYQVMKKTQEAMRLAPDHAVQELLGAIVYAAATILIIEENKTLFGK